MQPNSTKLLTDAYRACEWIGQWIAGVDFAAYRADVMVQSATERQFEIVGEALRRLERSDPDTAGRIGSLRQIIGFRDRLAHSYDDLDYELIYEIFTNHVPALKAELARELGRD